MIEFFSKARDVVRRKLSLEPKEKGPIRISTSKFISERLKDVSKSLDEISRYTGQVFVVMHSDTLKALDKTDNWPQIRNILENRGMLYDRKAAILEP